SLIRHQNGRMGSAAPLRVEVLGPLRVLNADGLDLTPPGSLGRRLLALLVLRKGKVVPTDAATDALWPAAPPRDPVAALQNHLSRLRQELPDGIVQSVNGGYRLDPSMVDVDADRLSALLNSDADGWNEIAAVLARWHGPAFAELADVDEG